MSFDFTPETDRQRIQLVAYQRPDLLRHPVTREKLYNRHVISRMVNHEDIGTSVMYRDFYMSGWSARDVTADDVRLEPMISGRGKMCRLMSTMGVARGIGDHGLMVKSSYVSCKEFLTCQPEIRVLDMKKDFPNSHLTGNEYLIMGTDGLWDVVLPATTLHERLPPPQQSLIIIMDQDTAKIKLTKYYHASVFSSTMMALDIAKQKVTLIVDQNLTN